MAGLTRLFGFHLRAWERSLAANPLGRAEKSVVCWAATVMVIRFAVNCFFAAYWLRPGRETYGNAVMLFNYLYLLAFWIVLPFLLSGISPSRRRISPARLLLLPLSRTKLFLLSVMNVLVRPVYGILFALSLVGLIPLVAARPTLPVVAGGALYAAFCLLASLCVSLAGEAAFRSRLLRNLLRAAVPLTLATAVLLNVQFKIEAGGLFVETGLGRIQWFGSVPGEGLYRFFAWTPAAWTAGTFRAGAGATAGPEVISIGLLLAAITACLGLAWFLVRWRYRQAGNGVRVVGAAGPGFLGGGERKEKRWKTPARRLAIRGLFLKEAVYAARSGDFWLTCLVCLFFSFDILTRADMTPRVFTPLLPLVFILNAPAAFNCFGLDAAGFGRFLFLPVGARSLLLKKNEVYWIVAAVQLVPVLAASLVRFGGLETLRVTLNIAAAAPAFACAGNTLSIYMPAVRSWHGFTASSQSGGLLGIAAIAGFWAALLSVENTMTGSAALVFPAAVAILIGFLYILLLPVWERMLLGQAEKMTAELKG